jgi:hypothetical protein
MDVTSESISVTLFQLQWLYSVEWDRNLIVNGKFLEGGGREPMSFYYLRITSEKLKTINAVMS